jgi:hypothetical protein
MVFCRAGCPARQVSCSEPATSFRLLMKPTGIALDNAAGALQRHLRARSAGTFRKQVDEKLGGPGNAPSGRMTHVVEVDVALDPIDGSLLRSIGVVFEADRVPSPGSGQARA